MCWQRLARYCADVHGTLAFTRPTDVIADHERPNLLRAQLAAEDDLGDVRVCELIDLADGETDEPGLEQAGFETIDLSGNPSLQQALTVARDADCISETAAEAIRESLAGARFGLGGGKSLRVDHLAEDGLFHRRSGPNRLNVNPGGIDGVNGHSGAQFVHGDQDVFGTPMRQMMHGGAPEMFRHVSPDGRNDHADTFLLNLWIPLHAPVQPLALMDRRTLDATRHQLRYGLPVDGFLERDDDAAVNDIWSFLYDDRQQWYIRTDMESGRGYVFDTLGTPHGAAVLAGEEALEELYLSLHRLCEAHERGDADEFRSIAGEQATLSPPADATTTISEAWQTMAALHEGAVASDEWCVNARAAMDAVIRRSVELRLVATLLTD